MPRLSYSDLDAELCDLDEPPEVIVTCEECGGEGIVEYEVHTYAPGCGFPHRDVEARRCLACDGQGIFIEEAPDACNIP